MDATIVADLEELLKAAEAGDEAEVKRLMPISQAKLSRYGAETNFSADSREASNCWQSCVMSFAFPNLREKCIADARERMAQYRPAAIVDFLKKMYAAAEAGNKDEVMRLVDVSYLLIDRFCIEREWSSEATDYDNCRQSCVGAVKLHTVDRIAALADARERLARYSVKI